jgi:hypothetical protein
VRVLIKYGIGRNVILNARPSSYESRVAGCCGGDLNHDSFLFAQPNIIDARGRKVDVRSRSDRSSNDRVRRVGDNRDEITGIG